MKSLLAFLCLITPLAYGQLDPIEIAIPMRDGESLAADLYLPGTNGEFPVILIQTPYNKNYYQFAGLPVGIGYDIENSPFAFVIADWRCFWGSTDACTLDFDRGEDGYDTVEWIAEQDWSNGKVGTWGPSALGNIQFDTANEQPPHLTCAVPKVCSPYTRYSSYLPGGALRTEYIETLSSYYGPAGFDLIIDNPYYNIVWTIAEGVGFEPENIEVPMLLVAGWYDHNTEENFELIEILSTEGLPDVMDKHKILIGPWVHGGTGQANVGTSEQGELEYPEAAEFDNNMERAFFDHYLLDIENDWESNSRFTYFQMGLNEWQNSNVWPPGATETQVLYLHDDLSINDSVEQTGELSYSYDPEDPSPTIGGKTLNLTLDQGPYDQRFGVEDRDDILVFTSETLSEDLLIEGKIKVVLLVETDRLDTDFCFRICDVYPDGRSMLLGEAVQRLRFRNGYSANDESFAEPGQTYEVEVSFDELSIAILQGHSIRLDISSSNYPRFNRNMNTGGEMYPNTNPDTLVNPLIALNTVHLDNAMSPSRIELPVQPIVNISQIENVEELNVYPNPCTDLIQIRLGKPGSVSIFDSRGQLVQSKSIRANERIDVSALSKGYYIIDWRSLEGENRRAQFLKQ